MPKNQEFAIGDRVMFVVEQRAGTIINIYTIGNSVLHRVEFDNSHFVEGFEIKSLALFNHEIERL